MAEDKKGFVIYCDLIHTIEKLPDDKAGLLFKHLLRYVNDQNPITNDLIVDITFEPIKRQLKRDLIKYEGKKEQWSEAGKASAEARRLKKLNETQRNSTDVKTVATDSTVTVTVKDTVKDTVTVKDINNINNFFKSLESSQFLEDIARNNKFDISTVKLKLIDFRKFAELEYANYNKFASHFKNWIIKNPPTNNEPKFVC
jgi:hypothetical protein